MAETERERAHRQRMTFREALANGHEIPIADTRMLDVVECVIVADLVEDVLSACRRGLVTDITGFRFEESLSSVIRPSGFEGSMWGIVTPLTLSGAEIDEYFEKTRQLSNTALSNSRSFKWELSMMSGSEGKIGECRGMAVYIPTAKSTLLQGIPVLRRTTLFESGEESAVMYSQRFTRRVL